MAARNTANVTEGPSPRSTRIITCANHKGGTGKTTTAVNVSAGLALLTQQRVLLVDCDPRGHALSSVGFSLMLLWEAVERHGAGRRPSRDCSATVLGVCTLLVGADQDRAQPG